jgi:hypothetical protein
LIAAKNCSSASVSVLMVILLYGIIEHVFYSVKPRKTHFSNPAKRFEILETEPELIA